MVFPFNKYEISSEANEMGEDESLLLQSAMVREQGTVLMRRVVAKMAQARSARARSARLAGRRGAIRLLLGQVAFPGFDGYESGQESEEDSSLKGRKRLSRPAESEDEGSSEDEPLSRRVKLGKLEVQVEQESEEEPECGSFESGSACGEAPEYGEEEEEDSEEESSGSDSDDDVIYMGRQSASTVALRQSLLSQFFARA
jgi:hypothetical protein